MASNDIPLVWQMRRNMRSCSILNIKKSNLERVEGVSNVLTEDRKELINLTFKKSLSVIIKIISIFVTLQILETESELLVEHTREKCNFKVQ